MNLAYTPEDYYADLRRTSGNPLWAATLWANIKPELRDAVVALAARDGLTPADLCKPFAHCLPSLSRQPVHA